MLCHDCKVEMRKIKTNYRYRESGLNNLILKGIPAYKCPKCKQVNPIIKNIKGLHQLIAQDLINKKSILSGQELVFLRKEMGIKAKDLAQILGVTKVTISRWENEKENIGSVCDRLIRLLYDNRIFKQRCEIVRPGIDKLESQIMKSMLISLCEPKTSIEDVFRNIKRRHVHSKISIPISNLNFGAGRLDSNLGVEFMDKGTFVRAEQTSSQGSTVGDFKFDVAYAGTATIIEPTIRTVTTVNPLTSPLSPSINRPGEPAWAFAQIN